MTHPSGLQYSYDDLDLVCCHGVDSEGRWAGSGGTKQGRRTRCASMPECCHQPPTEDLAQTFEVATSVVENDAESEQLELGEDNGTVPRDLQQELVHNALKLVDADISQRPAESEHLQTGNTENCGGFHCMLSSEMCGRNSPCTIDSSNSNNLTINGKGECGTETSRNHDICDHDNVFKSIGHISAEEQQCISICSNNGPMLSETAGEQFGKIPDHKETKESHTEDHICFPEISEATLTQYSATALEPQADLPDVEDEKSSANSHAGASATLPSDVLLCPVNITENGDVISKPNKTVEATGECDRAVTKCCDAEADKLDDPKSLNEISGLNLHSQGTEGHGSQGEQDHHECTRILDQDCDSKTSYQTLLDHHNVEVTAVNQAQGEERLQEDSSEKAAEVMYGANSLSDICVNSNMSPEQLAFGCAKGDHPPLTDTTQCADQHMAIKSSLCRPSESTDGSTASKESSFCEDQTIADQLQLENSCSKLDTIHEVRLTEADDSVALDAQKNVALNVTHRPTVQLSSMSDEHTAEQHTQNLPSCSAVVSDELSPEGLHGNQAPSSYLSESPACEAADGQRERHGPGATFSAMEEATQTIIYSDTQLANPVLDQTCEVGDQKEDNVVRVRIRKVSLNMSGAEFVNKCKYVWVHGVVINISVREDLLCFVVCVVVTLLAPYLIC